MTARISSASAYLLDAFLVAFVLLFLEGGSDWALALIWMVLMSLTAVASVIVSWKKPYKPAPVMVAATVIMALSLAAGVTVSIFALMTVISLYRLHARFSEIKDKNSGEGSFLTIFLLVMTAALIITLVNRDTDPANLIWPLSMAAIIFYVLSRLQLSYMEAKSDGAKWSHTAAAGAGITFLAGGTAAAVYLLADEARYIAGEALGLLIAIVFWPFSGLFEWGLEILISNKGEDIESSGNAPPEQTENQLFTGAESVEFDYSIGTAIVIILLVIAAVLLIRKIKADPPQQNKEEPVAEISRSLAVDEKAEEEVLQPNRSYPMVDIHEIRMAYREFESQAAASDRGREQHETVREWAMRIDLPFSKSFFRTYDKVRYSDGQISRNEADPFLQELTEVNEKIFRKDV